MAPFKSQAQAKFMFANKPKLAKEFAGKTKSIKGLPKHVKRAAPKAPTKPISNKIKALM